MLDSNSRHKSSPMRLLEILSDRFGAFEAVANSTIKLARVAPRTNSRWTCWSRKPSCNSAATCARRGRPRRSGARR